MKHTYFRCVTREQVSLVATSYYGIIFAGQSKIMQNKMQQHQIITWYFLEEAGDYSTHNPDTTKENPSHLQSHLSK